MFSNFVSLISKTLYQPPAKEIQAVQEKNANPFSKSTNNVFINSNRNNYLNYAKNRPVEGGYFAGYYNNKPNIVGRKLFIEI
ncbi:MAG: hypothetical protein E7Z91_04880 [Cyanobacteria bacterium SIG30]|nr:hypothetical protein [Cyanobacteria bacterium SIG30]